jgi:hypothetical protein
MAAIPQAAWGAGRFVPAAIEALGPRLARTARVPKLLDVIVPMLNGEKMA